MFYSQPLDSNQNILKVNKKKYNSSHPQLSIVTSTASQPVTAQQGGMQNHFQFILQLFFPFLAAFVAQLQQVEMDILIARRVSQHCRTSGPTLYMM